MEYFYQYVEKTAQEESDDDSDCLTKNVTPDLNDELIVRVKGPISIDEFIDKVIQSESGTLPKDKSLIANRAKAFYP